MTQLIARAFGDPQSAGKLDVEALIVAALLEPDPPAFLTDVEVATVLPARAPQARLVVVTSGPWLNYQAPITATNRVRVVAWDPDPDVAWDLSSWIHARLLAYPGDVDVQRYRYDAGPRRGKDPDYDSPIAAFTIQARMRPAVV